MSKLYFVTRPDSEENVVAMQAHREKLLELLHVDGEVGITWEIAKGLYVSRVLADTAEDALVSICNTEEIERIVSGVVLSATNEMMSIQAMPIIVAVPVSNKRWPLTLEVQ